MKRVIIVSGGKHPSLELFRSIYEIGDFIIGADSGAEFLKREGILPDLLLGDFDSIKEETLLYFDGKTKVLKYDAVKDFTDTEAAYEEAIKLHPEEIYFLGCTGSRLDHFIGNLSLLDRALKAGIKGYLMDFNCFNVHANAYETSLHYWAEKSSDDRYYVHMAKHLPEGFTVKEL